MVAAIITAMTATEIIMAIIMVAETVITGTGIMGMGIITMTDQVIIIPVEDQVMTATGIIHPVTGTVVIPTVVAV